MAKFAIDFKNTKQIALISAAVALGLLYVYINFLLLPQIHNTAKTYKAVSKVRDAVSAAERDVSGTGALKKQADQYRDKIDSYERMLPVEQEVPKLLENLSGMAKESGVKIVGITPLQSKQEGGPEQIYQEIPILISAKSGYHELGKFLSGLESSDRFMKVADIHVKENKSTPKKHDVELLVLTYVLLRNR